LQQKRDLYSKNSFLLLKILKLEIWPEYVELKPRAMPLIRSGSGHFGQKRTGLHLVSAKKVWIFNKCPLRILTECHTYLIQMEKQFRALN